MAYRLLFVEPPKRYWFVMGDYNPPPTTLLVLAAYVERELPEVDVQLVDCQGEGLDWPAVERAIRDHRPDMVLASGYTCNAYACARVVETAKRVNPDIVTVLGGQHFSAIAEDSLNEFPEVDLIVRGEGELTLVDLVRACMGRTDPTSVQGISFRHGDRVVHTPNRPLIEDLDTLPFPAYHLVEDSISNYHFTMMAGRNTVYLVFEGARGCDHRCNFCSQWNHWGGRWRTKSPKRIAEEARHLYDRFGGRFLWLSDDNFEYARRAPGIYEELKGDPITRDLMMFWQVRTDDVTSNPELVAKMREVGNYYVLIGAETSDPGTLEAFNKGTQVSQTARCIDTLRNNDVYTQAMWVIGARSDTVDSIEHLREFSQSVEANLNIYTALTPFPGTRCRQEAMRNGWIENDNWADYDMVHAIMPTETLTRAQVQRELYACYQQQYGNLVKNIRGFFSSNKMERTVYRHMASQSVLKRLRELV